MEKRQTAVEWLIKEFELEKYNLDATLDFARSIEKQQIKSIYIDGIMSTTEGWCGEMILSFPTTSYSAEDAANDYYKETYGE